MVTEQVVVVSLDKDVLTLVDAMPHLAPLGFLDASLEAYDSFWENLGADEAWSLLKDEHPELKAILAVDPPRLRRLLAQHYGLDNLLTLVAERTFIDRTTQIGAGSIVQHGCSIMRDVDIGTACKINMNSTLHHDVKVGNYSTIAPACTLLGRVEVGEGCYIGAGAVILPRIRIGDGATVGAGAVIVKPVADNVTVVGVPGRELDEFQLNRN